MNDSYKNGTTSTALCIIPKTNFDRAVLADTSASFDALNAAMKVVIKDCVAEVLSAQSAARKNEFAEDVGEVFALEGQLSERVDAMKKDVQELKDRIDNHTVDASSLAEKFDASDLAEQFDVSEIAEHLFHNGIASNIAERIDASDIAEHIEIDASDIAKHIDASDIAKHINVSYIAENIEIDVGDVAEHVAENIDVSEIACFIGENIDASDIAENIDASDIAGYVDASEIAGYVEIDPCDMDIDWSAHVDYDSTATALFNMMASPCDDGQRVIRRERRKIAELMLSIAAEEKEKTPTIWKSLACKLTLNKFIKETWTASVDATREFASMFAFLKKKITTRSKNNNPNKEN